MSDSFTLGELGPLGETNVHRTGRLQSDLVAFESV